MQRCPHMPKFASRFFVWVHGEGGSDPWELGDSLPKLTGKNGNWYNFVGFAHGNVCMGHKSHNLQDICTTCIHMRW